MRENEGRVDKLISMRREKNDNSKYIKRKKRKIESQLKGNSLKIRRN